MTEATGQTRLISLDAMRGFAVMGILAMNIIGFAMPEWAYVSPAEYGGETLADRISWFFSFVFIDGKMRGLFSLLFGASMMLVIERAEAKQQSAATHPLCADVLARVVRSRALFLAVVRRYLVQLCGRRLPCIYDAPLGAKSADQMGVDRLRAWRSFMGRTIRRAAVSAVFGDAAGCRWRDCT